MHSQPSQANEPDERTLLLSEVVELLGWELSILSNRQWEDLPELLKKRVVLACHLREINWTPAPRPVDWLPLKTQISNLEEQSRQKIEAQIELLGNQIFALQDQRQYWRECLGISFQKVCEAVPQPPS
jgi:hypothetical protein